MSIKKMLLLASMALAAIAFSAPTMAQADVVLTEEENPLVPGAEVTATSTDLKTQTETGLLTCGLVTVHFEVKENGGATDHVVLDPLSTTTQGCSAHVGGGVQLPVTIQNPEVLTPLTIDTSGTGWAAAKFTSQVFTDVGHINKVAECDSYIGAIHIQGRESGSDVLDAGPSVLAGTGAGCSPRATIQGSFTLETSDSTPVELDFVE